MRHACGIVLAGGKGTRMGELVKITNKHLLPVGPFPMIYYPIKKLVAAGITDIMLVSGTEHMGDFVELLGSGRNFGCELTYRVQDEAGGIAQALGLARRFCERRPCVVMLGDNIFQDHFRGYVATFLNRPEKAQILLKKVKDPQRFGVVKFKDKIKEMSRSNAVIERQIVAIVEKPKRPPSNYAVTGAYFYPYDVFEVIDSIEPSDRGELEITSVNQFYIESRQIAYRTIKGYWTDAGTPESWHKANQLVINKPPEF